MVTRKPVPQREESLSLPYPATPRSPKYQASGASLPASNGYSAKLTVGDQMVNSIDPQDASNVWADQSSPVTLHQPELPPVLNVGDMGGDFNAFNEKKSLPTNLQIGSASATPKTSTESLTNTGLEGPPPRLIDETASQISHPPSSNNPFRRKQENYGVPPMPINKSEESSAGAWADGPRNLPAEKVQQSMQPMPEVFDEPWIDFESPQTEQQPPTNVDGSYFPNADGTETTRNTLPSAGGQNEADSGHRYVETRGMGHRAPEAPMLKTDQSSGSPSREGHFIDQNPAQISFADRAAPMLPAPPPRNESLGPSSAVESTSTHQPSPGGSPRARRPSETYQIRLVNWYDASSPKNPRRSPTMVQNANGPCPLLALVNALVLSTPSDVATALVETLRVREQVSLGLLLDAVIDELMSDRRGSVTQSLPDVSDLYAFLVTLHTGMNVNPCFVPVEEKAISLIDAPIDHPIDRQDLRKPGGFENTREMRLYSTFAVPLIHGWIPPRNHPAFAALKRAARTYEDAQNLMFREEELEEKLQQRGLSQEEQVMLEDIASVKYFLSSTATQLTGYGLDTVTESMAPGSIAILFRNDHFSTLYRHPRSGQVLTLVTDMGYAGHEEVVWESLVDVSGEGCEFYAGDFRPVGNVEGDTQQQNGTMRRDADDGWQTVSNKSRKRPRSRADLPPLETLSLGEDRPPMSPNLEQEDHDLALAMQLQEEEEERERQEAAARRREDELSQAYLNNTDSQGRRTFPGLGRGASNGPSVPPRGGSNTTGRQASSAPQVSRRRDSMDDAPPPSYEQAAKGPAYHPPANHPAHPHASPGPSGSSTRPQTGRPRQQSSAYGEHAGIHSGSPSTHGPPRRGPPRGRGPSSAGVRSASGLESAQMVGRRRGDSSAVPVSAKEEQKDNRDCVVM